MYYPKESQFTGHASKRVYEEVYTNEDMTNDNVNTNTGSYTLHVPSMFASDLSQEKAISPRRVMCEPNAHIFYTRVSYWDNNGTQLATTPFVSFDFTSDNTMEECLNHLRDSLKITNGGVTYGLDYTYDKAQGILNLYAVDDAYNSVNFRFECRDYTQYKEIWSLFNQTGNPFYSAQNDTTQYNFDVLGPSPLYTLTNVWHREPLYVHATFSSSKKHYLCRTNDFWFKPSKYYYDNINCNDFGIFFTTDGSHFIIPYDGIKVIELCYILKQFSRL